MAAAADSDDDDLKKAIALSLADLEQIGDGRCPPISTFPGLAPSDDRKLTMAGLDRKAMEEERLARLTKRQRSISPPGPSRKAPKLEETRIELPSGARLAMFSSVVTEAQTSGKPAAAIAATEKLKRAGAASSPNSLPHMTKSVPGAMVFSRGIVKKTWAFDHERDGNDIKIEEVLEPATLRTAVLSSFQWDAKWILSKLKTPDKGGITKCVFVMHAKEQALRERMLEETKEAQSFLRLCFPPMIGLANCMHSKLMLLFHPNKLRVAIPTANLLDFDWGETGVMENTIFMIDLPRTTDGKTANPDTLTSFGKELLFFLEKQGLDQDVRTGLLKFDFSATKDMAFVHTIGGVSYKAGCERTGLPGLGRAVRQLDLQSQRLETDFAASSIGSLNDEYLQSFHAAARGVDMVGRATKAEADAKTEFFRRVTKKQEAQIPQPDIREVTRIYFPTHETVKASTAGAAGSVCISRKYWQNAKFPQACFRDYRSTRNGLLSHNKILYARGKQSGKSGNAVKDVAWAYVGSANMSESAWGKLSYDRKGKEWKMNCRNWECGVLLPVPAEKLGHRVSANRERVKEKKVEGLRDEYESESETESEKEEEDEVGAKREDEGDDDDVHDRSSLVGMGVFEGLVDPPFQIPGDLYGDRKPWFFLE